MIPKHDPDIKDVVEIGREICGGVDEDDWVVGSICGIRIFGGMVCREPTSFAV